MAEKSIQINDQSGGEAVATRDGYEQDDGSHDRVVQLVDKAVRHHGTFVHDTAHRRVTACDPVEFAGIPWSAVTGDSMTIGDAESLVVVVQYEYDAGSASEYVEVIPLLLTSDVNKYVLGFLEPKAFQNFMPAGVSEPFHQSLGGGQYRNFAQVQTWDLCGAEELVPLIYPTNNISIIFVDLWAWAISGAATNIGCTLSGTWASKPDQGG